MTSRDEDVAKREDEKKRTMEAFEMWMGRIRWMDRWGGVTNGKVLERVFFGERRRRLLQNCKRKEEEELDMTLVETVEGLVERKEKVSGNR